MKFHWFHLMPYPHLPDDFKERYHSVWVDPPAGELYDPVKGHQVYNDYLDQLEFAERAGFDGICVNEHHQNGYGLMPSPNLMAAALTRRTSRAKLVVLGNSVALYNPPIARRGRNGDARRDVRRASGLGLPGRHRHGHRVLLRRQPGDPARQISRGRRTRSCARGKTRKPFAFNGKYTQLRYVNPWPVPMQTPHPPIWIPGGGSVETYEWCVKNDFLYAYLSYWGYESGRPVMDGFWETVDKLGGDANPYRAGFLQFVGVAENDAEAERLYAGPAEYFYNRCFHIAPQYYNPPGYTSIATMRQGISSQVVKASQNLRGANVKWKDLIEAAASSPAARRPIVDRLNDMADKLHVGHVMLLCHYGNMSNETVSTIRTRFAREVIPKLRDRFNEYDDKWWPKSAARRSAEAGAAIHRGRVKSIRKQS